MDLQHISLGARVNHPTFGVGVVFSEEGHSFHIFFREHGEQTIARSFEGLHLIAPGPEVEVPEARLDMDAVKQGLEEVLLEITGPQRPIVLARKWEKGTLARTRRRKTYFPPGLRRRLVAVRQPARVRSVD